MTREFAAARERTRVELERATFQAYQTVRIWAHTRGRRQMPEFSVFLPDGKGMRRSERTRPQTAREFDEVIMRISRRLKVPIEQVEVTQTHGAR